MNSLKMEKLDFQSLQSFMTSYLIGCADFEIIEASRLPKDAPEHLQTHQFILAINKTIYIPLMTYSKTGFHVFSANMFEVVNGHFLPINFLKLVERITVLEQVDITLSRLFLKRVESSTKKMDALESSSQLSLKHLNFKTTEQSLIYGHFAHPYPKLQEQDEKQENFDFEKPLNLIWCLVKKSILHCEHSAAMSVADSENIISSTYLSEMHDDGILKDIPLEYSLFPIHPAQIKVLKSNPLIEKYFTDKWIIPLLQNEAHSQWTPTTSMRSIYNEKADWMLKFSLNTRLTNSIRVLQSNEVKRGIQVHEVFSSKKAQDILNDREISGLAILHEPLFLAIKDTDQKLINNTIVIFRENPFKNSNDDKNICLAVLNQRAALENISLLQKKLKEVAFNSSKAYEEIAVQWFDGFLKHAVIPLVILQARYGIYFGAHQQNLILKLDDNFMPIKAFYRDCQGSGYSEEGHKRFKTQAASLNIPNGNVLPVDYANSLMGYYLFINSTLFTISSLAYGNLKIEQSLIELFVDRLSNLDQLHDRSFINYILKSKRILVKDNFECCLKNINENVIVDPLSIYKEVINPFYQDPK